MGFFGGGGSAASNMVGATSSAAGTAGLVPAPAAGKQNSVLMGDATFLNLDDIKILPDQVSDCVIWLRSDDVVTSGSSVTTWNNKVDSNKNAVQTGDATKQPSLQSSQINGYASVRFDGTNDCLQISSMSLRAEMTVFLALKNITAGSSFFIEHSANVNTNAGFYLYGSGSPIYSNRANASALNATPTNWNGTNWNIVCYKVMAPNALTMIYQNRIPVSLTSNRGATVQNNSVVTDTLNIGSRNNGASLACNTDFAEIIFYDRPLFDFEISCVTNYLKDRYAL